MMNKYMKKAGRFVNSPGGSIVTMLIVDVLIAGVGGLIATQINKHKYKKDPLSKPISEMTARDLFYITHDSTMMALEGLDPEYLEDVDPNVVFMGQNQEEVD